MAPWMIRRVFSAALARPIVAALVLPMLLSAQGVPAEWEVRQLALQLGTQMDELGPALDRFDIAKWDGAPAAYAEQRATAAREAGYAAGAARQLAEKPAALSKSFELHLRMQTIESLVASLATGARGYQNDGAADDALNLIAATSAGHTKLRDYILDLAAAKDIELAAIDAEAQRCRAVLLRTPQSVAAAPSRPTAAESRSTNKRTIKKTSK